MNSKAGAAVNEPSEKTGSSGIHRGRQQKLRDLKDRISPNFPVSSWNMHETIMFADRITLSRILYYDNLYRQILGVSGMICEFGVQFGASLSLLTNLRGIHEPHNYLRKIVGFDTFAGFTGELTEAERANGWEAGDFAVPDDYLDTLTDHLATQESYSPIPDVRKFELVPGDVTETFEPWLERNPHAIIALAIFDFDVYAPTRHVLEKILSRMPKGAILAFDEINHPLFPGEAVAVQEVLGIRNLRLQTDANNPAQAWHVIE
ncbi:hypothetical protein [Novosphingobium album (ex Hu et al. 2023)]|uniref:Crotonobetainyl-CoA--carnitine CoA-transferase n=1 Tax=Novosphingobium album (ex Hu et al. 2023) TaxID=2930093 RepID=A0ABT0B367_9SPHN|nr:hypothetical protein [Novosphingobium album (ex Hu et al. 2023)]MCJ2179328.1 hypothetical protein [Novosphingobium album (ex Hu et al. 2023)]